MPVSLIINQHNAKRKGRTNAVKRVARTTSNAPQVILLGTVRERGVLISDLAKEVNPVRSPEQRRPDRVHRRIAPPLSIQTIREGNEKVREGGPRSRTRRETPGNRRKQCRPVRAKSPCLRSQSCSRLVRGGGR
jgi:hypothetical protein